ncbi:MAG: protein kinase domain-containing protein [Gemmatimonadaceae bacterium]
MVPPQTTLDRLSSALEGRYSIVREIGAGGMATVYLAEDVRHRRKVAIKVLHPELSAVLGPERFLNEIELTANLQHPHILPLFDSGAADNLLFYVMPYVEGETLRQKLAREHQLPVAEALRIATDVADALDYAHKNGVVHRDIKPENVLLHNGRPLVADFGIALAVQQAGGERMTQTGMSLGTPQYMAPEQAMGDKAVDHRADIYALGAVTYEMLTGEPPFTGPNAQAVVAKILTTDPSPLQIKRRSIPPHVEDAVLTALEKMPADRFSSAREFSEALDGRAAGGTTRATTSMRAGTVAGGGWRWRLRDPVTVALAVAAVAAVAYGLSQSTSSRDAEPGPTVRFPLTLPPGMAIATSTQTIFSLSPDGALLAFAAREPNGMQRLFTRAIGDPVVKPLIGTDEAFIVFFSPDGEWLGFVSNAKLKKVRSIGGTVMSIADLSGIIGGGAWGAGGEIVISMGSGLLYAVPETGGEPRRLCTSGDGARALYEASPTVLPDGKTVMYSSWSTQSVLSARLGIGSLATGECEVLELSVLHPLGVVDGLLVYVTDAGAVMAAPLDLPRRRITGVPKPLLSDVEVNQTSGTSAVALSASGSLMYQSGSPASRMVLANLRGEEQPFADVERRYAYPRYSPDGKRVAVSITAAAQRDVWVMDISSGTTTRLTTDGALNERPEWTPDGKKILYRTARDRRSSLWWRTADLSAPPQPLLSSEHEDYYEGVITPDGAALVYQLDTAGADVMFRRLSGDTTPMPIASTQFNEAMPRVSHDGRWVAYVTSESGGDQIVVQPLPGPGARVQVSVSGGSEPVWARDGRRLFYRDNQNFMVADVSTSPAFSVVSREVLFRDVFVKAPLPHANYDVSPDGTRLLVLKATEEAQVVVVHNWVAEMRSQLRGADRR